MQNGYPKRGGSCLNTTFCPVQTGLPKYRDTAEIQGPVKMQSGPAELRPTPKNAERIVQT